MLSSAVTSFTCTINRPIARGDRRSQQTFLSPPSGSLLTPDDFFCLLLDGHMANHCITTSHGIILGFLVHRQVSLDFITLINIHSKTHLHNLLNLNHYNLSSNGWVKMSKSKSSGNSKELQCPCHKT